MVERTTARRSSKVQKWTRIAILIIGAVTIFGFVALSPILRAFIKHDHDDAAVRIGSATVEQIIPPHFEENAKPIPAQVSVRVNGTLVTAQDAFGTAQLHIGGTAQVTYRVGWSGKLYVDRVEPLPAASDSGSGRGEKLDMSPGKGAKPSQSPGVVDKSVAPAKQ